VSKIASRIGYRYMSARIPLNCLAFYLIRSVHRLEQGAAIWSLPQERGRTIADIENAARIVEQHLFRLLMTTNRSIAEWRQNHARMVANALYEKEKDLIVPAAETRGRLSRDLTRMLVNALNGNWDEFETADNPPMTWVQRYKMVIAVTKDAVVAVLPSGLFITARHWSLIDVPSPVADYITAGLLLWGVVSVISAIDPTLRDKISTMKDALSIVPGFGKSGDKS
jgi:hypothetical protein